MKAFHKATNEGEKACEIKDGFAQKIKVACLRTSSSMGVLITLRNQVTYEFDGL